MRLHDRLEHYYVESDLFFFRLDDDIEDRMLDLERGTDSLLNVHTVRDYLVEWVGEGADLTDERLPSPKQ